MLVKAFSSDTEALSYLNENFLEQGNGILLKRAPNYFPTQEEWDAINYLIIHWDFIYRGSEPA